MDNRLVSYAALITYLGIISSIVTIYSKIRRHFVNKDTKRFLDRLIRDMYPDATDTQVEKISEAVISGNISSLQDSDISSLKSD